MPIGNATRRLVFILFALGATAALGACADPASELGSRAQVVTDDYQAFADELAAQLAAAGVPGGALAIVADGQLAFATGLGEKRAGSGDAVDADTQFRIGSVSKTFAAAAAMSLREDDLIGLDEPITTYVPEVTLLAPSDPSQITTRLLLSHQAGLPDVAQLECATGPGALASWFADRPNLTLWSPPGRIWNYSNLGFSLAGWVLEAAAGQPYPQIIQDRLLTPLGLTATTFEADDVVARGNYASSHPGPGLPDSTLTECALTEPPGYLYSSAKDMARFAEAFLHWGDGLLDPLSILEMGFPHRSTQMPPDMFYGLGLVIQPYRDTLLVWHNGALPGYRSSWVLVPEHGFAAIILANGDTFDLDPAALAAVDAFLDLPDTAPIDWSTPPSDWARYTGTYADTSAPGAFPPPALGSVVVTLEGDHLFATLGGTLRLELHPFARDTFFVVVQGVTLPVTFWRDHLGRGEYFATRAGVARRSETAPPASPRAAASANPFAPPLFPAPLP